MCMEKLDGYTTYSFIWTLLEGGEWSLNYVIKDRWIPNYPTNRILHLVHGDVDDIMVADLINGFTYLEE